MAEPAPQRRTILLVDDYAAPRRLLETTLADDEYEILQAESGARAIETALALQPDLILLNLHMPGNPNGLEVCRTLKANRVTADTTIIMLTATHDNAARRAALAHGTADCIAKPFSSLVLPRRLDTLVDRA